MNNVFTYNENTRTLIIKAEADLSDLKKDEAFTSPWSTYEASVEHLILEDIDSIGSYHFKNLPNLFSVTFPPTLRSVHHHAFFGCKSLTEINLPMGYTLNSIYEPAPIPEKSIRYGLSAFKFTPYLEDAQGTYFIKDAFLISVNKNLDIHEIPEGITRIHPLAFEDILAKTVILPASLKSFDPITFAVSAPRLMIFKNHETEISNDGNNLSEKNNKIPPLYNLRATNIPGSALKKLEVCEVSSYKAYHEASKDSKAAPSDIPHVKGHRYLDLSEAMLKRLNQGHYLIMINKEKEESNISSFFCNPFLLFFPILCPFNAHSHGFSLKLT